MNIRTPIPNIEQAHLNMIHHQIRAGGVRSQDVLDTFFAIRREHFVSPQYRNLAFADMEIPLSHGENMLRPQIEALILEATSPHRQDTVLEIGTGSGYMAAILGYRASRVTSVEIEPDLAAFALKNLTEYGADNIEVVVGNGAQGWGADEDQYDVIVISGSLSQLPDTFKKMLRLNGRLVSFIGEAPYISAQLTQRVSDSEYKTSILFETSVKPLREQTATSRFRF